MRLMAFPAAFMANTFAMMLVMIGLSLFGKSELAADFGLVHGATVALFYSFSGNARSLILRDGSGIGAAEILRLRFLMVLPLSLLALMLCIGVVGEGALFVSLLVVRRAAEWLAEIFLSERELRHRARTAFAFFAVQGFFSFLLLLVLIDGGPFVLPITVLWVLSPLLACIGGDLFKRCAASNLPLRKSLSQLLPHFGSTAVIGISVYVFRLFILLVVGKQVAGDLFSAFALGGILGAVFAQALGPTMIRSERVPRQHTKVARVFNGLMIGMLLLGLGLGFSLWLMPGFLHFTLKDDLFWMAVSCSLIGGVVMVQAQRTRLRIIQNSAGADVFGSDMLSNILLVASIPFLFYSLGVGSLAVLYLLGAVLSWMFYASERSGLLTGRLSGGLIEQALLLGIAAAMFLPLFFQLDSGVFVDTSANFSSGGMLGLLPIPLSVFACYAGIVLLGGFSQARLSLVSLFFVFVGMLLASLLVGEMQGGIGRGKLILIIQYMLPMFALVLGQQYGSRTDALGHIGRTAFGVLMIVVPVQLVATLSKGAGVLLPSLFVFSIYQYLQYVPVLFVSLFLIAISSLSNSSRFRPWLQVLALLMGAYVIFSWSMLALTLFVLGILALTIQRMITSHEYASSMYMPVFALAGGVLALFYVAMLSQPDTSGLDLEAIQLFERMLDGRLGYLERWDFYISGISGEWVSGLLGRAEPPPRGLYPSALNYYLDFVYNFGLLGIAPLLALAVYTVFALIRWRQFFWFSPAGAGLAGVVLFMLFADSSFKVGLRQPYPGIIMFFLWGVLLSLIDVKKKSLLTRQNARYQR